MSRWEKSSGRPCDGGAPDFSASNGLRRTHGAWHHRWTFGESRYALATTRMLHSDYGNVPNFRCWFPPGHNMRYWRFKICLGHGMWPFKVGMFIRNHGRDFKTTNFWGDSHQEWFYESGGATNQKWQLVNWWFGIFGCVGNLGHIYESHSTDRQWTIQLLPCLSDSASQTKMCCCFFLQKLIRSQASPKSRPQQESLLPVPDAIESIHGSGKGHHRRLQVPIIDVAEQIVNPAALRGLATGCNGTVVAWFFLQNAKKDPTQMAVCASPKQHLKLLSREKPNQKCCSHLKNTSETHFGRSLMISGFTP